MAPLIVRKEIGRCLLKSGPRFSSNVCMRFVKRYCNVVLGLILCVEEVRRLMPRFIDYYTVVLKAKLMGTWIKRGKRWTVVP